MNNLGYDKPLFILAFDHRSSFMKMFGLKEPLTKEQTEQVSDYKYVVYEGFMKAVAAGAPPKAHAGILVDEQFGAGIHHEAFRHLYLTMLTTEKSGQDEFDFEYGDQFGEHIEKFKPTFAKALIRYNPEGDQELNARQRGRLKILSDYCREHGRKFLIEPLIPATPEQLQKVGGDQKKYDLEVRYQLMIQMIKELQDDGVEPDVWKIEGLESEEQYRAVVAQAQSDGRLGVKAVVLGRGADRDQVKKWLVAGSQVDGVIGFAIGRTIFKEALTALGEGKINREEAIEQIAKNYSQFYRFFTNVPAAD